MVRLRLSIKAELENVTNLQPAAPDFEYFFKVKCTSCNEEHPKWVSMNRMEEYEVSGGKHSTANFVWRCGMFNIDTLPHVGRRESSAKFDNSAPLVPYSSENGQLEPLLVIECRGLEFINFDPKGVWKCAGRTGTVFLGVDLSEGEWTEYDEKAALPVNVSNIESEWSRA